jgi:phage virion morphogenesis protein
MAGLVGDFARLAQVRRALGQLGPTLRRELVPALAREALDLVHQGFRRERDPDGRAWAPLKRRVGPILHDSGRLEGSLVVRLRGMAFQIVTDVVYAAVHQFGHTFRARGGRTARREVAGVTLPARPFLPLDHLPERWAETFDDVATTVLARPLEDT